MEDVDVQSLISDILAKLRISRKQLVEKLDTTMISLQEWEEGKVRPTTRFIKSMLELYAGTETIQVHADDEDELRSSFCF